MLAAAMLKRAGYKATSRENRRFARYVCVHCGGRCLAHHAVRYIGEYGSAGRAVEYECPCGGLTMYAADGGHYEAGGRFSDFHRDGSLVVVAFA